MDLIKKNVLMFSILGITLIIVGVLTYMVLVTHGQMGEYIEKVNRLRDEIKELGKKKPRPVADNVVRIKKDIKGYTGLADNIVKQFGQPSYPALQKMCKVLNTTPDKLRTEFREYWEEHMKEGGGITLFRSCRILSMTRKKSTRINGIWRLRNFSRKLRRLPTKQSTKTMSRIFSFSVWVYRVRLNAHNACCI